MRVLVVVAGGPARTMVGYMCPGAEVVVPGWPRAGMGDRFDRILIHEAALAGSRDTAQARQDWFNGLEPLLAIGGTMHRINTLSGVVDEALSMGEVAHA